MVWGEQMAGVSMVCTERLWLHMHVWVWWTVYTVEHVPGITWAHVRHRTICCEHQVAATGNQWRVH
jgi:hypothetical protein